MKKDIFIPCDCTGEALHITSDEEGYLYVSIWQRGYAQNNILTWRQRLRYCWQILTKGCPYGDQVVLNKKGRSELIYGLVDSYILNKTETVK